MPTRPRNSRPSFARPRAEVKREADRRRGSARARGYTWEWDKAAAAHLAEHPLCFYCEAGAWDGESHLEVATLVDHYWPHRGDVELFWARQWWCSSCRNCHVGPKQALEARGPAALAAVAETLGLPPRLPEVWRHGNTPDPGRGG